MGKENLREREIKIRGGKAEGGEGGQSRGEIGKREEIGKERHNRVKKRRET